MLLTVGWSYVGNYVTPSTLLDRACACSYENLPKYRSYRVSNTAPRTFQFVNTTGLTWWQTDSRTWGQGDRADEAGRVGRATG